MGRDILDPLSGNVSGQFFADGFLRGFLFEQLLDFGESQGIPFNFFVSVFSRGEECIRFLRGWSSVGANYYGGQKKPAPLASAGFLFA